MATLDKLSIQGVRSFGPDRAETLEFTSPLTLIVGHNGAGKTTIIECLKYATTGDLPPNSRNGAFIYDPKLARVSEVKAQVRLRFRNARNQQVTCVRSLAVTQKQSKISQRTLDSTLSIRDPRTGESHDLSSRCAAIDEELGPHLGVSKAILDHVVFCHQEDSFWPLSEPAVLKKKFDEIFASTRYTKVLVDLRDQKKTMGLTAKGHERDLTFYRANKDKARKVRDTLRETLNHIGTIRGRIDALDGGEIDRIVAEMTGILEQQQTVANLTNKRVQVRHELGLLTTRIQEMSSNLEIYQESDEELHQLLDQYIHSLESHEQQQQQLEGQKTQLNTDMATVADQISALHKRRGQLEAERDAYLRHLEERTTIAVEIINENRYTGFDTGHLSQLDIQRFVSLLRTDVQARQDAHGAFKADAKAKESALVEQIQTIRMQISTLGESKRHYLAQIGSANRRITEAESKLLAIHVSQNEMDSAAADVAAEETALAKARAMLADPKIEAELRELSFKASECERQAGIKSKDIASAVKQLDIQAHLDAKKADLDKKREMRDAAIASASTEISTYLGSQPRWETAPSQVDRLVSAKQTQLKDAERQQTEAAGLLRATQLSLADQMQRLTACKGELQAKMDRIVQVCGGADYMTAKDNAEADVLAERDEVASMNSVKITYVKYLAKGRSTKACALCSRGFDHDDELEKFLARLQSMMDRVPAAIKSAEDRLRKSEARVKQLVSLQGSWSDCERLRTRDVPEAEAKVAQLQADLETQKARVDEVSDVTSMLFAEHTEMATFKARVDEIARLNSETVGLERELASLTRDLGSTGIVKNVNVLQSELQAIQSEQKAIKEAADSLQEEKQNRQRDAQMRENRVRDARERIEQLHRVLKERDQITQQIADIRNEIAHIERTVADVDAQAQAIGPEHERLDQMLVRQRNETLTREAELQSGVTRLSQSLDRVVSVQRELLRYEEMGGDAQFGQCQRDTEALQQQSEEIKEVLAGVATELDRMSKQRSEVQVLHRTIDDNLKLRQLQADKQALETQIQGIEADMRLIDVSTINGQYTRLKGMHERLVGERAQLVGEQKQLEENARRLEAELRADYRDVDLQFQDKLIELQLAEKTANDLDVYARALDRAIMMHHQHKMEEINKIIRELWTKTYRGSDIDTIEIRWDPEKETGTRSYNYRVVMVKGDTELDMRGRCSAGQKVLTSIIIRLALAETFCVNCGILALDEPTTNLDRENIESLAESLAEIIENRRSQTNFQLIVITHDEEFMHLMGMSDFVDYFYRVEKGPDGCSSIERQQIGDR